MNKKEEIEKARVAAIDMFKQSISMMFVKDKKTFDELREFINEIAKQNEQV
jgi:hypothetical protein